MSGHYDLQTLMDLMGQQTTNVNSLQHSIRNLSGEVAEMRSEMRSELTNVKQDIADLQFNEEVTYEMQQSINNAVDKTVCRILGIGLVRNRWTPEERLINEKYGNLFRKRCRREVTSKGHLAFPFRTTKKGNFTSAIKDIEAWTPRYGIEALKREADDAAEARRIARELGYSDEH